MKKTNLFLSLLLIVTLFANCTGNKKTADSDVAEQSALMVDDILAVAEQEAGKKVVVEGLCTHVCSHGGKKLFLMGSDDSKTIRVESNDDLGAFKTECTNSMVRVKGELKEERIDEAYLVNWENALAEGTAEEHGEDGEGCETEQKAQGQTEVSGETERIADFRKRIAARNQSEGKNYLSFYYIAASEYAIQ